MKPHAALLFAWLGTLAPGTSLAVPLPNETKAVSVGTINCASSTCHGSVTPWDGNVLRNEYTTWTRLDPHATAFAVLRTEASRRMVRKLGWKEEATEAAVCLGCHAHDPTPPLSGERHDRTEGVGCEGCHGPAAPWLKDHTRPDTPHSENVARGLYPTDDPVAQARLCLSCHFGDESRYVTHEIMGAGHPRLSFDLSTFTALQPPHYRVDDDYQRRKGRPDAVRAWAVGQLVAARQLLVLLSDPVRGRDGLFPEFTLFDCHACHHPMSDLRWRPRMGMRPGRVRLNDSSLLMARAVVRVVDPGSSPAFEDEIRMVQQAVSSGRGPAGEPPLALAQGLAGRLERLIPVVADANFPPSAQRRLLLALVDHVLAGDYGDYAGAEQAYMGIASVTNDLVKRGLLADAAAISAKLGALLDVLHRDEAFDPEAFAAGLETLRRHVDVQVEKR